MTIKILLVDDNLSFRTAVKQFLDMLPGAQVVGQAHDGLEALTMAEQLAPDLMLLDVAMPGLNGLEVARRMQLWPMRPRIIFLSMHDIAAYRTAAHDLGDVDFVGKADFVTKLLPIIECMVQGSPVEGQPWL
jgi:DNA-binding NarL/FixJ family response regulator